MIRFRGHIPAFVDYRGPNPAKEFDTLDELLGRFSHRSKEKDFSHFALAGNSLMAISDEGFSWWVLGSIMSDEPVDLPQWEGGKYHVDIDGVPTTVTDALSFCNGEVTLKDGRVVKEIRRRQ